jgi:hypothetical protein
MAYIFPFPPVGIVGAQQTVERPIARSQYAYGRGDAISANGPARIVVTLTVSALSRDRAGAGWLEQLWALTDGGAHFVRVPLPPVNWHLDHQSQAAVGFDQPLTIIAPPDPLTVIAPPEVLTVYQGQARLADPSTSEIADFAGKITVTGLPPGFTLRAGDVVRVWSDAETSAAARAGRTATAGSDGVLVAYLDAALPAGVVSFGDTDSRVMRITNYQPGTQGVGQNWQAQISFREALPFETTGATERTPW